MEGGDRLVGVVVLAICAAVVLVFWGTAVFITIFVYATTTVLFGAIVLSCLDRGKRSWVIALMPITLFGFFPSKRVRSLIEQVERREANGRGNGPES